LKRLADICISILFLLIFPLHFLINPHPFGLIRNSLLVLFGRRTWVGYSGEAAGLPLLPHSVLGPAGKPHKLNQLPAAGLSQANEWYALEYDIMYDLITVFSHYKKLGVS